MNELFNWSTLATYGGATAAVVIVTQLLKGMPFISKIPTRLFSYLLSLVLLLVATFFSGGFSLSSALLCLINAAVVSLAGNGVFDAVMTVRGQPVHRGNKKKAGSKPRRQNVGTNSL